MPDKLVWRKYDVLTIFAFGIAIRALVSLYSYSGENNPPLFGDYEAQRHWQEVTVNLNAKEWYTNSSANDLQYWGLDYPPLTAYHSLIIGQMAKIIDENYVSIFKSRGFESRRHKAFMRFSVLLSDAVILLPAYLLLAMRIEKTFHKKTFIRYSVLMIIYPGQILIDNGHFQYNNMSLGLAALAITSVLANHDYLATFLFTLAINYKQMELYHAIPLFFYLLQQSISGPKRKFFILASIVLLTFFVLWHPWINEVNMLMSVIGRLFPIQRGVFEDKIANFWCALNAIYKLKTIAHEWMALICLFTTAMIVIPINIELFLYKGKDKLLYALTNTALAFFLFSYQVHEKSILLVVLPCSCLIAISPVLAFQLLQGGLYSMFPLFSKDKLIVPFYALLIMFSVLVNISQYGIDRHDRSTKIYNYTSTIYFIITLLANALPPPIKYPFLWPYLISMLSFINFSVCFMFGVYVQMKNLKILKTLKI